MQDIAGDFCGISLKASENLSEKERKDDIHLFKKIWRTFGYLIASLGHSAAASGREGIDAASDFFSPAVVDALFDAARPIQDKSSCHRARDFTKVCCSGHESDSWANGQFFFLHCTASRRNRHCSCSSLACLSQAFVCQQLVFLFYFEVQPQNTKEGTFVELSFTHWRVDSKLSSLKNQELMLWFFFHTFRLVPVAGGSSWGWSWSRWAHAGREFGSCQSLIAQDSRRCESRLFKGHRSLDELPAHPASKATYVSNCFLYNQQVLMRLARVRHEYTEMGG